jgi:hypothetical protein
LEGGTALLGFGLWSKVSSSTRVLFPMLLPYVRTLCLIFLLPFCWPTWGTIPQLFKQLSLDLSSSSKYSLMCFLKRIFPHRIRSHSPSCTFQQHHLSWWPLPSQNTWFT